MTACGPTLIPSPSTAPGATIGGGMNPRLIAHGRRREEGGDFPEGRARRLDHDARDGKARRVLRADENGRGAARAASASYFALAKKEFDPPARSEDRRSGDDGGGPVTDNLSAHDVSEGADGMHNHERLSEKQARVTPAPTGLAVSGPARRREQPGQPGQPESPGSQAPLPRRRWRAPRR